MLQHSSDGKLAHSSATQYSATQSMYESFYHVTAAGNTFRAGNNINSSAPDTATTITPAAAAAVVANQLLANGHHILTNGSHGTSTVVQYAAPHHSVRLPLTFVILISFLLFFPVLQNILLNHGAHHTANGSNVITSHANVAHHAPGGHHGGHGPHSAQTSMWTAADGQSYISGEHEKRERGH